jgi:hypothetical protein
MGYYDKKPFTQRILTIYRTDSDDDIRMFCIRLLVDMPGTTLPKQ